MKITKRHILYLAIAVVVAFFLSTYQLPYYIYKPGGADALNPIVAVEDGYDSKGDMHLVTVSGGQATPIQYAWAKILAHHEILPLHKVRSEGISDEEYFQMQLQMMEGSQEASIVVAYEAAGEDITIEYDGVYVVAVVEGMPADGKLKSGDRITGIDGKEISEATDLTGYVEEKHEGDTITLIIERDKEQIKKEMILKSFPDQQNKVGIGIRLVTDRQVKENPKVDFSSGEIGGPSAGLMFSLEIYDQLTKEDLTRGYQIAGTGQIDYKGNVYRIGGIDKKVIAADSEGCSIFFAPNEKGAADSNYMLAKKTAEEIGTEMKIVPVDTFTDALNYLQDLDPQS